MDEKKCIKCKEIKRIEKFVKNKNAKNGYGNVCIKCRTIQDSKRPNAIRVKAYVDKYMYGLGPKDY